MTQDDDTELRVTIGRFLRHYKYYLPVTPKGMTDKEGADYLVDLIASREQAAYKQGYVDGGISNAENEDEDEELRKAFHTVLALYDGGYKDFVLARSDKPHVRVTMCIETYGENDNDVERMKGETHESN